jgi:hypothetical protein
MAKPATLPTRLGRAMERAVTAAAVSAAAAPPALGRPSINPAGRGHEMQSSILG